MIRTHMAAFGCALPAGDHIVEVPFPQADRAVVAGPFHGHALRRSGGVGCNRAKSQGTVPERTAPWWFHGVRLVGSSSSIEERIDDGLRDLAGTTGAPRVVSTDRPALVHRADARCFRGPALSGCT